VKCLCQKAGIGGYKTNHSLRVTVATRLFQNGMDEQLIMERTGHRSTDGIQAYKRSCNEQQALVSRVLNREKRNPPTNATADCVWEEKENKPLNAAESECEGKPSQLPKMKEDLIPSLSFSGCSGVTINYNFGK